MRSAFDPKQTGLGIRLSFRIFLIQLKRTNLLLFVLLNRTDLIQLNRIKLILRNGLTLKSGISIIENSIVGSRGASALVILHGRVLLVAVHRGGQTARRRRKLLGFTVRLVLGRPVDALQWNF